jgi:hypothetical protein
MEGKIWIMNGNCIDSMGMTYKYNGKNHQCLGELEIILKVMITKGPYF